MSLWQALGIGVAGFLAGTVNVIVGSGTLITFPTLLFFGYPPVTANISNTLGLVAGGMSGSWGYRHELTGHSAMVRRFLPLSLAGGTVGALLLLWLPAQAFRAIVPVLIGLALVLVVAGPRLPSRLRAGAAPDPAGASTPGGARPSGATPGYRPALLCGVFGAGVYGGYFGAAQGVLLMGLMSALTSHPLQRLNAVKNVLATTANVVAAAVFATVALDRVDWAVALLIAVGSIVGGLVGARLARRIPPRLLRALIVAVGTVAIVKMVWFG